MQTLEAGSDKPARNWCFWSTTESIQSDVPSVTAIVETLIAVPLYWWVALQIGMLPSLLVAAAVAPLVLLRSEESMVLGVRWFLVFENRIIENKDYNELSIKERLQLWLIVLTSILGPTITIFYTLDINAFNRNELFWMVGGKLVIGVVLSLLFAIFICQALCVTLFPFSSFAHFLSIFLLRGAMPYGIRSVLGRRLLVLPATAGLMTGILAVTIGIRIAATMGHFWSGIKSLPQNFRRLVICTSPAQIPEIIPGIESTDSEFRVQEIFNTGNLINWSDYLRKFLWILCTSFVFLPAWLYRLTIKSTAWFWWPLAFLGGELWQARNPDLFRWNVMGSLWARTSIALVCLSLLAFAVANLVLSGAVFEQNPLLTPLGYLLLIDWTPRLWQICALVGSALSLALVFMLDHVVGEYRIGRDSGDLGSVHAAERKFGWIERLSRLRLLLFIVFWLMVGTHAILYFNSQRCWFSVPPKFQDWTKSLYGDHLPPGRCLDPLSKAGL